MIRVSAAAVLSYEDWQRVREVLRPLFIKEKERRRVAVGDHLTLLFENVQTVWYQIEEMLRVERIAAPEAVAHEIETYSELLPGAGELSATLLIEYADADERDAALRRLVGIDRHLWLRIGDRRVPAEFEGRQIAEGQVSSVQFVRFAVGGRTAERLVELAASGAVAFEADHPALSASAPVDRALAVTLAEDLRATAASA